MNETENESAETRNGSAGPNGSAWDRDEVVRTAATIGVIGVGAALIEVGLIPGMIIGVAAAYAPKYLPKLGASLQPAFKSAVRGAYRFSRRTREAVAEAKEQVHDIVAEVHAEDATPAPEPPAGTQPHL